MEQNNEHKKNGKTFFVQRFTKMMLQNTSWISIRSGLPKKRKRKKLKPALFMLKVWMSVSQKEKNLLIFPKPQVFWFFPLPSTFLALLSRETRRNCLRPTLLLFFQLQRKPVSRVPTENGDDENEVERRQKTL